MTERRRMESACGPEAAERVLALLGLARRAGRLAVGATSVEKLVRQGARPVIVLASDAGSNQQRRASRWQPIRGVVAGLVRRCDLARQFGRGDLAVVAVADAGFVRGLIELGVVSSHDMIAASSHDAKSRRR